MKSTTSIRLILLSMLFLPVVCLAQADFEKLESGLRYRDVEIGEGAKVKLLSKVRIAYNSWIYMRGKKRHKLETSTNTQTEFTVGIGQVIRGLDEGVKGMRNGGVREIIVPPELAYGEKGKHPVPPDATLFYEIRVLKVSNI